MKNKVLLIILIFSTVFFAQTTPIITYQPQDQTVSEGQVATFTCSFAGPTNKGYQWWKSPYTGPESKIVDIPGEIEGSNTSQLRILNTGLELDGAEYLCEVKDLDFYPATGSWLNSNVATLYVNEEGPTTPTITFQPQNQTVTVGESAVFTCYFSGPTNKGYQWWKSPGIKMVDGNGISGATTSQLIISVTLLEDNGSQYTCEVKDLDFYPTNGSWVNSNTVTLTVLEHQPITPVIVDQPQDISVIEGQEAVFKCSFTGPANKGYQWYRVPYVNAAESKIVDVPGEIEGSTTSTLKLLNVSLEQNGKQFLCETKDLDFYPDDGSWLNSNAANLTVNELPTLTSVAYYPFNGNANDESGNNLHGIVYGATLTVDRNSENDRAYHFDGDNDKIDIGVHSELQISNDLSLSVWINPNTLQGTSFGIISCQLDGSENLNTNALYSLGFRNSNRFLTYTHESGQGINHAVDLSNYTFNLGEWYHVAVTRDVSDKRISLYVNGSLVDSRTYDFQPEGGSLSPLTFGENRGSNSSERFFEGRIDDIGIYDRLLTENEILSLYSPVAPVIASDPEDILVNEGEDAIFKVTATCNDPMGYQWWRVPFISEQQSKVTDIPGKIMGATTNQLSILNASPTEDHNTEYLCEVYNSLDKTQYTNSSSAMLKINSSLSLISPNGGENWESGSKQFIRWSSINVNNVIIEYSINNGTSWEQIVKSIPSTGSYEWIVPNLSSEQCKIRISDSSTPSIFDLSDNIFTIFQRTLLLTSPNGDELWEAGTNQTITWTSSNIQSIKIEYSSNNGSSWNIITNSTLSDGSYNWSIPNSVSSLCKVKISDIIPEGPSDESDTTFSISPAPNPLVILSKPNGGEGWIVGSLEKIIWSSQDIDQINLQYSSDNGSNWIDIASNIIAAQDTFEWQIPDLTSEVCLVRIENSENISICDTSNSTFSIYTDQIINPIILADSIWNDTKHDGVELGLVSAEKSTINFGTIVSYVWTIKNDTVGLGVNPTIELPSGTNELVLTVVSDLGNIANVEKSISVYAAKLKTEGKILSSVSQLDSKNLFISSMDDKVYKFDSTGTEHWSILTGESIQGTICISDADNIYVGSTDARLYAFDKIGVPRWDKAMGGIVVSSPSIGPNKELFVGLTTGRLFSMNEAGQINWTAQVDGSIISSPSISNNMIYFGTTSSKVYGLYIPTGEALYEYSTEDSVLSSPAIDKDGNIIIGSNDGYLYKLNRELKLIWKYYSQGQIKSSPVIDEEGNIYFGSANGYVYALSKEKDLLWKYYIDSPVNGNPTLSGDGSIFIGSDNGRMTVLNKFGKKLWHLQTNNKIYSSPLITKNNLIYVGSTDSSVYVLKDPNLLNQVSNLKFDWPTFKGNNQRTGYVWEGVITSAELTSNKLPKKYRLNQNYPNPFNPSTKIQFGLPKESKVSLVVYNLLGQEVINLVDQHLKAGYHKVDFDNKNYSSGIYFYRLQAGNYVETKKMILLK